MIKQALLDAKTFSNFPNWYRGAVALYEYVTLKILFVCAIGRTALRVSF